MSAQRRPRSAKAAVASTYFGRDMPWTSDDAERFTSQADTAAKRETWAVVANERLEQCLATHEGEVDDEQRAQCEQSAIRQANAAVNRMREGDMEMADVAQITLADGSRRTFSEVTDLASEAATLKAQASGLLRQLRAILDLRDVPSRIREEIEDVVTALRANWSDLGTEAETERDGAQEPTEEQATKLVDGVEYLANAFLVVEDPESPSTWHLRVRDESGDLDHQLMGAAWAALTVGYRGNTYEGPGKEAAMRKLRALYSGEDMETPTEMDVKIGNALDAMGETLRSLLTAPEPVADLAESAVWAETGGAIELLETDEAARERDPEGPLRMRVVLIEPGLGNERDNHLYEAEMLRRDAHVFEGVKMYATDHRETEKSVRTEVGDIAKSPVGFTETGGVVAEARIWDPAFAKMVRNRQALGALNTLHDSIKATGKIKRAVEWDGRRVNRVEQIVAAESVDWVTQAGAGGRALALMESESGTEVQEMSDRATDEVVEEQEAQETETVELRETEAEAAVETEEEMAELSLGETLAALIESGLPKAAQSRIAERAPFASAEVLQQAIRGERDYIAELTEANLKRSPRVFANSGRAARQTEGPLNEAVEEAADENLDQIIAAHLGR